MGYVDKALLRDGMWSLQNPDIFYLTGQGIKALRAQCHDLNPFEWQHRYTKKRGFTMSFYKHELKLTDLLLAFKDALAKREDWHLLYFERDKRGDTEIKAKNPETGKDIKIHADALLGMQDSQGKTEHFVIEFDNCSETDERKIVHKMQTLRAFNQQGVFMAKLEQIAQRHDLAFDVSGKVPFRVLFINDGGAMTTPERRRHWLFERAMNLKGYKLFWFATLQDFLQDPLGAVFIRGKDYQPVDEHIQQSLPNFESLTPRRQTRVKIEAMRMMKRQSIIVEPTPESTLQEKYSEQFQKMSI